MTAPQAQRDDLDLVATVTAGVAVAAALLGAAVLLARWLAEQPPIFWGRAVAVGVVVLGLGAMGGAFVRIGWSR